MASRSLDKLTADMKEKAESVLKASHNIELDILIYCTLRPLDEQARLYRQSRSWGTIKEKITKYRQRGFGFLADVLERVGPQTGQHVTNAGPGESFHNFGLAFDAVPLSGGKPIWNYLSGKHAWEAYGGCVRQAGLEWAGDWTTFREYPHAQLGTGGNPLKQFTPDQLREKLIELGLLK